MSRLGAKVAWSPAFSPGGRGVSHTALEYGPQPQFVGKDIAIKRVLGRS